MGLLTRLQFCISAAVALLSAMPLQAAEPNQVVIGKWKFVSVLDGTQITSIDEKEAKKLLGHVMTIDKAGAKFGGDSCGTPTFEARRVEPNLYLRDDDPYVNAAKLGLPNPVTVVDISCTDVFIKSHDKTVIFWDGFYFEAVRVTR
jgi:hypothetical protein